MKNLQTYKYSSPTRYDLYPCGMIWNNIGEDSKVIRYIQTSDDETSPNWQILGDFLEMALAVQIGDSKFINKCITSYREYLRKLEEEKS